MGQIWSSSFSPQLGLRSKGQTAHSTSQEGYSLTWWMHHDVAAKKHRNRKKSHNHNHKHNSSTLSGKLITFYQEINFKEETMQIPGGI
jgi:hypothetical protein